MKEVLKERQADMLKYLITASAPLDLDFFKEKFEKQDRTIRYDLGELKELCARHGIEISYQMKQGYYIPATQKTSASKLLVECEVTTKTGLGDSSEEERFESLLLYLFVQKGYVTAEKMASAYYLSRSTLSRILGKMEAGFDHAFSLKVRKASGYCLEGDEMALRRLAAKILAARFRGSYTAEDWFMLLPSEFKGKLQLQDVIEISQNIRRLNSKYNVWISNASYLNLLCYCMVKRLRIRLGYVIKKTTMNDEKAETYEDEFLIELIGTGEGTGTGELEAFSQILRENGIYTQKGVVEEAGKKVLVVCATGKGLSHLLALRIKNVFPMLDVVGQISPWQLSKVGDLKDVDFVISTIPLENKLVPVIKISRILSEEDIKRIRDFLKYGNLVDEIPMSQKNEASFGAKEDPFLLREKSFVEEGGLVEAASILSRLILTLLEYTSKFPEKYRLSKDAMLGMVIHMSMAVPRWFGESNQAEASEDFEREYQRIRKQDPDVFALMEKFFDLVEKTLRVRISLSERVAFFLYITEEV